jgi:hypothetical protein
MLFKNIALPRDDDDAIYTLAPLSRIAADDLCNSAEQTDRQIAANKLKLQLQERDNRAARVARYNYVFTVGSCGFGWTKVELRN